MIIIISPLDIKDLSFRPVSLFLSLLFSLSLSLSPSLSPFLAPFLFLVSPCLSLSLFSSLLFSSLLCLMVSWSPFLCRFPRGLYALSLAGSLSVSLDDSLLRSLASLSRSSFLFLREQRAALELRDREMTIYKLLPGILLLIQNASLDARLVHYAKLIHGCDRRRATQENAKTMPTSPLSVRANRSRG